MSFEVGQVIEGKVTGITKFGAFVEIEPGVNGMVHISEIAATYVSEIRDFLKEGQTVKAKVLSIGDNGKVSLSIKKALPPQQNNFQGRSRRPAPSPSSEPRRPANFDWNERKNEPASFEDMMTRFKQNSNDKMSGMKQRPSETRRSGGYSSRKGFNSRPDDY